MKPILRDIVIPRLWCRTCKEERSCGGRWTLDVRRCCTVGAGETYGRESRIPGADPGPGHNNLKLKGNMILVLVYIRHQYKSEGDSTVTTPYWQPQCGC